VERERAQNELALNVYNGLADYPGIEQPIEVSGECRSGHTYLPKSTPHT